jgi:hypothetical protein
VRLTSYLAAKYIFVHCLFPLFVPFLLTFKNDFSLLQFASDQPATIGVDFKVKSIEVEGKKVRLAWMMVTMAVFGFVNEMCMAAGETYYMGHCGTGTLSHSY